MQHLKYWSTNNKLFSYDFNYVRQLLRTNIKFAFWTPRSAIHYSDRLHSGESFILNQITLYPFHYNNADSEFDLRPVEQLNAHASLVSEYISAQLNGLPQVTLARLAQKFKEVLAANSKLLNVDCSGLPAASLANLLFIFATTEKFGLSYDNYILKGTDSKATFLKIVQDFAAKGDLADADSVSKVIFAVNKLELAFDVKLLEQLLENKKFRFEFTAVEMTLPHLNRYKEWQPCWVNSLLNGNKTSDQALASILFEQGYFPVLLIRQTARGKAIIDGSGLEKHAEKINYLI